MRIPVGYDITIAAITIGIAVDNSIHYIYRFKEEFKTINSYSETLDKCHNTVGIAILNTSITIVFWIFNFSFSNFYFYNLLWGLHRDGNAFCYDFSPNVITKININL